MTGAEVTKDISALSGAVAPAVAPAVGAAVRVGGDMAAKVEGRDGDFRSGACRIDTPLPEGYPAPTPIGAIDLKTYPLVRLAEVSGTGDPDRGKNQTFWPLFNHIKQHGIAMTSPVEMNYQGLDAASGGEPKAWSMAFLYRRPEMNRTGDEGPVRVRDAQPLTVVSIGLKGDYTMKLVHGGMEKIEAWLSANPRWEAAGEWRSLYYNGPSFMYWNKWAEVQLPVKPGSERTGSGAGSSAGSGA